MVEKQDGLIFHKNPSREVLFMLAVAGLGFMVDVYDMALFGVVRVQSLNTLGVTGAQALSAGVLLLNWQMAGMALGGMLWGVLGDKRGRRSILLGSIVLYSIANIANAFVNSVDTYAAARFFVGLGLAGEVGAAMTIAAEVTPKFQYTWGDIG
jgi:putative MFS transporter